MAMMLSCPVEIVELFIKGLPLSDIQSFRLTCSDCQAKSFGYFQKNYFTQKIVSIDPESLARLLDMARDKNFGCAIQTLVIKFHDEAMLWAADDPPVEVFTKTTLRDRRESLRSLFLSGLLQTPYLQRAVRDHSPGDLIYSKKEYRLGDTITVDMAHRLNTWIVMVQTGNWKPAFSAAVKALPSLTSIMLWDGRVRVKSDYSIALRPPHPMAAFCKAVLESAPRIREVCLSLRQADIESPLDWRIWAGLFAQLTRIAIAVDKHYASDSFALAEEVGYLEHVDLRTSLPCLEELRFFCSTTHARPDCRLVYQIAQWMMEFPLKRLRVLCAEDIPVNWITLDFLQCHPSLKILVWNSVMFYPNEDADVIQHIYALDVLKSFARGSAVQEYWVEGIYNVYRRALFLNPESIKGDARQDIEDEEDSPYEVGENGEDLHRGNVDARCAENAIVKVLKENGKEIHLGKPDGCIGHAFEGYKRALHPDRGEMDFPSWFIGRSIPRS